MAFMFENLTVYQKAVGFADQITGLTESFPRVYYLQGEPFPSHPAQQFPALRTRHPAQPPQVSLASASKRKLQSASALRRPERSEDTPLHASLLSVTPNPVARLRKTPYLILAASAAHQVLKAEAGTHLRSPAAVPVRRDACVPRTQKVGHHRGCRESVAPRTTFWPAQVGKNPKAGRRNGGGEAYNVRQRGRAFGSSRRGWAAATRGKKAQSRASRFYHFGCLHLCVGSGGEPCGSAPAGQS
jgi:hypothetical protein